MLTQEFTYGSISGLCNFLNCTECSPAPSLPAALPLPNGLTVHVLSLGRTPCTSLSPARSFSFDTMDAPLLNKPSLS